MKNLFASEASVEQFLAERLSRAGKEINLRLSEAEQYARREPAKALLWAFMAGYLVRLLPLFPVTRLAAKGLRALLGPATFLLGAAAALDVIQKSRAGAAPMDFSFKREIRPKGT
jgi:hypothetical protein